MNEKTRARALRILEKRDVSRAMLLERLLKSGTSETDAEEAADWLCSLGVVDDRRFSELVVRHYAAKGYGLRRIREELHCRGIAKELWEEALAALPETEETVYALLRQKLRGTAGEAKDLQRAQGFLLRRGYSWEEIREAMDRYRAENEETE